MPEKDLEKLHVVTLLYVEPKEALRQEIGHSLKPYVQEIVCASDTKEGLDLFNIRKPDIVMTAINFPGEDGLEMVEVMRKIRPETPVIITTSTADSEHMLRSINIGVDAFITKPVELPRLLKALFKSARAVFRQKESEEHSHFIRHLLDSSPTFMLTLKGGEIEYVNKTFLKFMGYDTLADFLDSGANIIDHIDKIEEDSDELFDTDMWLQYIISTPEKQHIAYLKGVDRKSSGKPYIIQHTEFPEMERYIFTFSDITQVEERKEKFEQIARDAQKEIELKQKLLEMQSRQAQMGEMIGAIAHQWKQPLNTLSLIIQDVEDAYEFGELDEPYVKQMVQNGVKTINYMTQTIDDFKNFFKPNKEKAFFDIKGAILEVLELLGKQYKNNHIKIDIDSTATQQAYGFNNEFKQVIINILNNARDAFNDHHILKRHVLIDIADEGKQIRLSIKDNAGGIPKAVLEKLFEPYITTKSEEKGTGIGLYMSKIIIDESLHGSITARNQNDLDGPGAEFLITLPASKN